VATPAGLTTTLAPLADRVGAVVVVLDELVVVDAVDAVVVVTGAARLDEAPELQAAATKEPPRTRNANRKGRRRTLPV
jgi:hypothetical protein